MSSGLGLSNTCIYVTAVGSFKVIITIYETHSFRVIGANRKVSH